MKVTHRIPTTQYGYVEIVEELDSRTLLEMQETLGEYASKNHARLLVDFQEKPESTLPEKEFSALIYTTLHNTMDMDVEQWELCNPAQKNFLKLLKNAMARKKPVTNLAS